MRDADQADTWIATKEAFLQAEESSDSLDTVETLLKNQLNFEKSLTAYEEKIKALRQSADELIQQEHVDSDLISKRCKEVLENWERLKKRATTKVGDLGESRKLFQFLRDAEEVNNRFIIFFLLNYFTVSVYYSSRKIAVQTRILEKSKHCVANRPVLSISVDTGTTEMSTIFTGQSLISSSVF